MTACAKSRARLHLVRRHTLNHAWMLSLAVAARDPGSFHRFNFVLEIDQLAFALLCGGSGVAA